MKKIVFAAMFAASVAALSAQAVDYQGILAKIDEMANFQNQDISMSVTLVTDKPGSDRSVKKAKFFRRDRDDAFLMLIEQPDVNKGEGYLKVDDNLWFYDPNTRAFSHTSIKEKFSDSQANNDDFSSSKMAVDYKVVTGEEAKLGKFDVYVLTLEATSDKVTYPMEKIWVTRDKTLVLKTEDYSLSKRLMRTSLFTNYQQINGRYIPLTQLYVDNLNVGEKTQMTMADVNIGTIPDTVFTKSYVERVSK